MRKAVLHWFRRSRSGRVHDGAMPKCIGAEVEISVLIDRARLEHHDVDLVDETAIVVGNLAQVAGDVMTDPRVVFTAVVTAECQLNQKKCSPSGSASRTARGLVERQARNLTSIQSRLSFRQSFVEHIRLREGGAIVDPIAGTTRDAASAAEIGRACFRAFADGILVSLLSSPRRSGDSSREISPNMWFQIVNIRLFAKGQAS